MNASDVVSLHIQTMDQVVKNQYFVPLFNQIKGAFEDISTSTDPNIICEFWNAFWFELPDSTSIRRHPFDDICELAEGEYLD